MWQLELLLLGVSAYLAWRLHQVERNLSALDRLYNELATLFDERFSDDNKN